MTPRKFVLAALTAALVTGAGCSSSDDGADLGPTGTTGTTTATPIPPNTAPSDAERAGSTTTTAPTASPTASTSGAGSTPAARCTTAQLEVTVRAVAGEAGAGHQYRSIVFTNTGTEPCLMAGFPGVSFTDASGAQLGPAAVRDESVRGEAITIAAGAMANAVLDGSPGELYGPDECGTLAESAGVRVYPPDETVAVTVPLSVRVCSAEIGQFRIRPVQAGGDSQP